jgi:hypothetical protein
LKNHSLIKYNVADKILNQYNKNRYNMAAATSIQKNQAVTDPAALSAVTVSGSNRTYVSVVLPNKENGWIMTIAKIFAGMVTVPVAFIMDVMKGAYDWAFPTPKTETPVEQPKQSWLQSLKGKISNGCKSSKEFLGNHKTALIIGSIALGALGFGYYFRADIAASCCNRIGYLCNPQPTDPIKPKNPINITQPAAQPAAAAEATSSHWWQIFG